MELRLLCYLPYFSVLIQLKCWNKTKTKYFYKTTGDILWKMIFIKFAFCNARNNLWVTDTCFTYKKFKTTSKKLNKLKYDLYERGEKNLLHFVLYLDSPTHFFLIGLRFTMMVNDPSNCFFPKNLQWPQYIVRYYGSLKV